MITSISDYVGKYSLSKGIYDNSKLQEYIDRYEPRYLKQLLGVELYNEFVSDLSSNVPQSPNFIKIFNPLSEDVGSYIYGWNTHHLINSILDSEGIKEMLKGFIYFEYAKDLYNQMTPYGQVKPKSENSEITNTLFSLMYTRYNEAIRTYSAIQEYIVLNRTIDLGQIVLLQILNGGSGYVDSVNVPTINGTGTNATVDIITDGMGLVTELTMNNLGINYTIGDTLIVDSGGINCEFEVLYVGVGDYRKFRGVRKLTNYWL